MSESFYQTAFWVIAGVAITQVLASFIMLIRLDSTFKSFRDSFNPWKEQKDKEVAELMYMKGVLVGEGLLDE